MMPPWWNRLNGRNCPVSVHGRLRRISRLADGCRRPCDSAALHQKSTAGQPSDLRRSSMKRVVCVSWCLREFDLIAQDTTDYGHDLGMKDGLAVFIWSKG